MNTNTQALTVTQSPPSSIDRDTIGMMQTAGHLANEGAAGNVFAEHLQYKADETQKAYQAAVTLFSDALAEIGIPRTTDQLMTNPEAWRGVTWAMIQGFRDVLTHGGLNKKRTNPHTGKREMVLDKQGQPIPLFFAISSINQRLSIVRKMALLAGKADVIGAEEMLKIKGVRGYSGKESRRVDEKRDDTRATNQKKKNNFLTNKQVGHLLEGLPESPQGRRDQLLLAMLIYLGMRVSELADLTMADFDLMGGRVHIDRPKTDKNAKLAMPWPLRDILRDYLEVRPEELGNGRLLASSLKSGQLVARPMSKIAIQIRVRSLGEDILGIDNLSPHDFRHSLAEELVKSGASEAEVMDVLGWKSSAMVHVYRDQNKTVNVPNVWK